MFLVLSIFLTGELYVQAQRMFNDEMFSQLIGIIDLAIKQAITTNENFESEFVSKFLVSNMLFCNLYATVPVELDTNIIGTSFA